MRSGLYPKLLGDSCNHLHEAVRRLHASGGTVHAVGVFRVRHGSSWLARTLAHLLNLPAAAEAVEIQLFVTPKGDGEEWRRMFAGQPLVSWQSERPDGLLAERFKLIELRFQLQVAEGALSYRTRSAALCLGSLRLPLPGWFRPVVLAWESAVDEGDAIDVTVEVRLPLLGRLIAYEGKLTRIEARQ